MTTRMKTTRMTTRRPRLLIAGLLIILAGLPSAQEPDRVVLISVDGLMPATYTEPSAARIPNLRRLKTEGTSAAGVIGVLPSNTFPAHTTLVSGVGPAVHGIVDNAILDPEGRSRGGWYWYAGDVKVPTLLTAGEAAGRRVAAINWPVTVGLDVSLLIPDIVRSGHPESLALLRALSSPELFDAAARARGGAVTWPLTDADWTAMARFALESRDADLVALHLLAVDGSQHTRGAGSAEARRAIESVDAHVGTILESIERSERADRTYVVVVSDHGFSNLEGALQPNALFRQEGLIEVNAAGRVTEWQAYFHASGGSGFVYLKDPNDAALRRRVGALLAGLTEDPAYGIASLWTADDLAARQAHPEAAFGIGMRPGWYALGGSDVLTPAAPSAGGHGFPPEYPDLHASLIIRGPGVTAARDLGIVRMTQIGPTLARLLGVRLGPDADEPLDVLTGAAP